MEAPARERRRFRVLRALGVVMGGLGALTTLLVLTLAMGARTERGRRWILDKILDAARPVHGELTADALETDLFSWVTVSGISLRGDDGHALVQADRLALRYRLGGLPGGLLRVEEARIEGLVVALAETPAGIDIATLWEDGSPPASDPYAGLPIELRFDDISIVDASVGYTGLDGASYRADGLIVGTALTLRGTAVEWARLRLAAPVTTPALGALSVTTEGRWDPGNLWFESLDITLGANQLAARGGLGRLSDAPTVGVAIRTLQVDAASLEAVTGPLPVTGRFRASGSVVGALAAPSCVLDVSTPGGGVALAGKFDGRGARPTWSATLSPRGLSPAAFVPALATYPSAVEGTLTVEGTGITWPGDLDAKAVFSLTTPRFGPVTTVRVGGSVALSGGVVEAPRLALAMDGADLAGAATARILDGTADARLGRARLDLALLERFGVSGLRGAVSWAGRAGAAWPTAGATGAVSLRLDGDLVVENIGYTDIFAAASLQGPVSVAWIAAANPGAESNSQAKFTAALTVDGLEAAGASAARATVALSGSASSDGAVDCVGTAALVGVGAPSFLAATLDVEGTFARSAAGRLAATSTLQTGAVTLDRFAADRGAGKLTLAGDLATASLDLRTGARTVLGLDAEADLAARAFRAQRLELAPGPERAWRAEGVQTARLVDGGVTDLRLRLVSGTSLLSAAGSWFSATARPPGGPGRTPAPVTFTAEARDVQLGWLEELYPERFAGYAGLVNLHLTAEGSTANPTVHADLSALGLVIPGVLRALDVDADVAGADHQLQGNAALTTGGHLLANVHGRVPFSFAGADLGVLPGGAIDLRVLLPPSTSAQWNIVLPGAPLPELRASAELALTGPLLDPGLSAVVAVEAPVGRSGEWVRLDLDATSDAPAEPGTLRLRGVARERLERRGQIDGSVALGLGAVAKSLLGVGPALDLGAPESWAGDLSVDLVPLRLPVQALSAILPIPPTLLGDLSGGLHLAGPTSLPRVEGALLLTDGRIGGLPLSPALVALTGAEGGYRLDSRFGFGVGNGTIDITGFVPFDPRTLQEAKAEFSRPTLALEVHAVDVPLEALGAAVPGLHATAGALRLDGTVTGSVERPVPDLSFGLADGDFVVAATGVRYAGARASGTLVGNALRLEDIYTRTARRDASGRAAATGSPGRESLALVESSITGELTGQWEDDRPRFTGQLSFKDAWIADLPGRTLRTNGALRLTDNADGGVHLAGELSVNEGQVALDTSFFTKSSDLAFDPTIRVHRGAKGAALTADAQDGPLLPAWLDAEVQVFLARNVFLEAEMPMEESFGELTRTLITLNLAAQLDGEVTAVIEDGELSLVGSVEPLRGNAGLLGGAFELRGNAISFTGRDYTNPVLDLVAVRSTVDYGDLTAIIRGTPSTFSLELSADDTSLTEDDVVSVALFGKPTSELGQGEGDVLSEVGGMLLASLVKEQANTLGRAALDLFEFDSVGLRAGRRFGKKVFLLGAYNFTADTADENLVQVTLEVQINRDLQFDFTTGTSGISSVGLVRRWRF